jgi:hypothetical protein
MPPLTDTANDTSDSGGASISDCLFPVLRKL